MQRRVERRTLKWGDETDICSRWSRRWLCCLTRAGVRSAGKRQIRRRERREGKEELRHDSTHELQN